MSLAWGDVEEAFEPDGALRDLYVLDVLVDSWDVLIRHLDANYVLDFEIEGRSADLPSNVSELFRDDSDPATRLLRVHRSDDGLDDVNIHFFTETEIEMDLDPRSITDQDCLDRLVELMAGVASALGRQVVLTPENLPSRPIVTIDPTGTVETGSTDWR